MLVRLIKDARINHKAGDIVGVSPVVYDFLVSTGVAVPVSVEAEKPKEAPKKRTARKAE